MPVIPYDLRLRIVHTFERVGTLKGTARQLHLRVKVVKHWVRRHQATGSVQRQPMKKVRSFMTPAASEKAVAYLREPGGTGDYVARRLFEEGFTAKLLHKTTVVRAAKKLARSLGQRLRAQTGKGRVLLRPDNVQARLRFAQSHQSTDWHTFMFTDRKKFLLTEPGNHWQPVTWVIADEKRVTTKASSSAVVNIYAGITVHGMTKCHVVTGSSGHKKDYKTKQGKAARNITSDEYRDVLLHTLLPEGDRLFGARGTTATWNFQQDNDPSHGIADSIIRFRNRQFRAHTSLLKHWPPNSPDLNIIENVWSYVSSKVKARGCHNVAEFSQAVTQEMANVPQAFIDKLFASMPNRIKEVIKGKGARTKY
jgi:hypothetical protein